jgi:hypothetical protein
MKKIMSLILGGIVLASGAQLQAMSTLGKAAGVASILTGVQSVRDICLFKVRNFTQTPYFVNIRNDITDATANIPGIGFKVLNYKQNACFDTGLTISKRIWLRTSPSQKESQATMFDLSSSEITSHFTFGLPYEATIWGNSKGVWLILKGRHKDVLGLVGRYIAVRHDATGKLIVKDLGVGTVRVAPESSSSSSSGY